MGMRWSMMRRRQYRSGCPIWWLGPILVATSLITMSVGTIISLCMFKRLNRAMETLAMANALAKLEDRLSDVERADLEGRIRARLFPD